MKESKNSNPLRIFDFTPQLMSMFPPNIMSYRLRGFYR